MGWKEKSTKTHQEKAKRCLDLIKNRKGEVHWGGDELGRTYSIEFKNGSWLVVKRYRNWNTKDAKHPYYTLTYTTWDKRYNQKDTFLKATNMIGKKIFDELKQWYETTKTYPN